jgi:hypothetical protein
MAADNAGSIDPMSQALNLRDAAPAAHLEETELSRRITGSFGTQVVSQYISRFVLYENQGVIVQPYLNLDFSLFDNKDGFVKSASIIGGIWSSIHSHHPTPPGTSGGGVQAWYELDWSIGAKAKLAGGFDASVIYSEFTSPSRGLPDSSKNIIINVGFDDTPYLEKFAVHPYAQVLIETDGMVGTDPDNGTYLELGINPGITFDETGTYPITLSLPVAAGFSLGNFYNDGQGNSEFFGGVRIGLDASVPLTFMNNAGYGTWTANAGATWWIFGDGVKDANEVAAGNNPSGALVVNAGVNCNF